jgi:hypothetical protein
VDAPANEVLSAPHAAHAAPSHALPAAHALASAPARHAQCSSSAARSSGDDDDAARACGAAAQGAVSARRSACVRGGGAATERVRAPRAGVSQAAHGAPRAQAGVAHELSAHMRRVRAGAAQRRAGARVTHRRGARAPAC